MALENVLKGLSMAGFKVFAYSHMDDVNKLGEDKTDIILMDDLCQVFEAISGAIPNRNCQPIILGLGSWAGHQDWPL
jgi:hypothetical protein